MLDDRGGKISYRAGNGYSRVSMLTPWDGYFYRNMVKELYPTHVENQDLFKHSVGVPQTDWACVVPRGRIYDMFF